MSLGKLACCRGFVVFRFWSDILAQCNSLLESISFHILAVYCVTDLIWLGLNKFHILKLLWGQLRATLVVTASMFRPFKVLLGLGLKLSLVKSFQDSLVGGTMSKMLGKSDVHDTELLEKEGGGGVK